MPGARFVASVAFGVEVLACKYEVGDLVIETRLVQTDDVGVPPFMVRMAIRARSPFRASVFAMKTEPIVYVCRNIFVTIEA